MKNFKRKLARVFGLALRSDLERVNEAYDLTDKAREHNYQQSQRYRQLWRDTQKSFDQYIKDHA